VVAHEGRPLALLRDRRQPGHRLLERRGVLPGEREVHRLHRVEVELQVELPAPVVAEERALVGGRQVDLAEQHGLAVAAAEVGAQVAQELVRVLDRALGHADGLEQERDGVHAEARQALLEPEAGDLGQLVAHLRVGDVEVGLLGVEAVQVPLARLLVPRPVGVLLVGEDDLPGSRRACRRARRRSRGRASRARSGRSGTTGGGSTCG
jgi:hypothetical protein